MHHDSSLWPLAGHGFVLACLHGRYTVGGEDLREVSSVGLWRGTQADSKNRQNLNQLLGLAVDVAAARAPSVPDWRSNKDLQAMLGALSDEEALAVDAMFQQTQDMHAAAARESVNALPPDWARQPRWMGVARNGKALLAYQASMTGGSGVGLDLPGVLRWVDVNTGQVLGEWASHRTPLEGQGKGLERFSSVQLGRPLGLSWDGTQVLLHGTWPGEPEPSITVCQLADGLPSVATRDGRVREAVPIDTGWLVLEPDEHLSWLDAQLRTVQRQPLPKGVVNDLSVTPDGRWVALRGLKSARVAVLDRDTGETRWFAPHQGASRNDWAITALSDDGAWLASQANDELVLTRLADGQCWRVGEVKTVQRAVAGQAKPDGLPPAIAFVGDMLGCVQGHGLAWVPLKARGEGRDARHDASQPTASPDAPLDQVLAEHGLAEQLPLILPYASPALMLHQRELGQAGWAMPDAPGAPALGASRMGGWPDLPAGQAWPQWQDRPMAFVGQINLRDAHAAQPGLRVPPDGLLLIFIGCSDDVYDTDDEPPREQYITDCMLGTDATNDAWCVLHAPASAVLQRTEWQELPLPELKQPQAVDFVAGGAPIPIEYCAAYDVLKRSMPPDAFSIYNAAIDQLAPEDEEAEYDIDQFMGHPRIIQSTPPEWMCEQAVQGQDPWSFPETEEGVAALDEAASQWAMLLQLGLDVGRLYVYGPREAMARGDFSGVWINYEN